MRLLRAWALGLALLATRVSADECSDDVPFAWSSAVARNPLGSCSGRGNCSASGECVCEAGWTGLSDVVNTSGLDCQIHDLTVRLLWAASLLACLVLTALGMPKFRQRYADHMRNVKDKAAINIQLRLVDNRGLLAELAYLLVTVPGLVAMAVTRIAFPEQRIGVTYAMTLLFVVTRSGFYCMVWLYQPALLATLLRGKRGRNMRWLVALADKSIMLYSGFSVLVSAMPLVLVALGGDLGAGPTALAVWYVFTGGIALSLVCNVAVAWYIKQKVMRQLDQSYSVQASPRILELRGTLVRAENTVIFHASVNLVIYVAFCFWPFLYNRFDYWLPVSLLSYSLVGYALANTVLTRTRASNGDNDGNGAHAPHSRSGSQDANGERGAATSRSCDATKMGFALSSAPEELTSFERPAQSEVQTHSSLHSAAPHATMNSKTRLVAPTALSAWREHVSSFHEDAGGFDDKYV